MLQRDIDQENSSSYQVTGKNQASNAQIREHGIGVSGRIALWASQLPVAGGCKNRG